MQSYTLSWHYCKMKSTKVLNPRRCIMRVTRNTHARTRETRAVQIRSYQLLGNSEHTG